MAICLYAHVPICSLLGPLYKDSLSSLLYKKTCLGLLYKGSDMPICPYTRVATSPYGHVPHMPTVGIPLCAILLLGLLYKEISIRTFISIFTHAHMSTRAYAYVSTCPCAHMSIGPCGHTPICRRLELLYTRFPIRPPI